MTEAQKYVANRLKEFEWSMLGPYMMIMKTQKRRKNDFLPYFEPFRPLNEEEIKSIARTGVYFSREIDTFQVSYQALTGGFTICNIIVGCVLYSGSSHCSKTDQWLPIRGQMLAFKRALESTGISLPTNLPDNEF